MQTQNAPEWQKPQTVPGIDLWILKKQLWSRLTSRMAQRRTVHHDASECTRVQTWDALKALPPSLVADLHLKSELLPPWCAAAALHCIAVDLECIFGWLDRPLHYRLWFTQYSVGDCVGLCLIDNLYVIITHVFVHVYCLPRYVRISVLCCVHMCILCIYVHLTALMCPKQLLYTQLVCFSINQLQILPWQNF